MKFALVLCAVSLVLVGAAKTKDPNMIIRLSITEGNDNSNNDDTTGMMMMNDDQFVQAPPPPPMPQFPSFFENQEFDSPRPPRMPSMLRNMISRMVDNAMETVNNMQQEQEAQEQQQRMLMQQQQEEEQQQPVITFNIVEEQPQLQLQQQPSIEDMLPPMMGMSSPFARLFDRLQDVMQQMEARSEAMMAAPQDADDSMTDETMGRVRPCLRACAAEADAFCASAKLTGIAEAVPKCLAEHRRELAAQCAVEVDHFFCDSDVARLCQDAQMTGEDDSQKVDECLLLHLDELSTDCKFVINRHYNQESESTDADAAADASMSDSEDPSWDADTTTTPTEPVEPAVPLEPVPTDSSSASSSFVEDDTASSSTPSTTTDESSPNLDDLMVPSEDIEFVDNLDESEPVEVDANEQAQLPEAPTMAAPPGADEEQQRPGETPERPCLMDVLALCNDEKEQVADGSVFPLLLCLFRNRDSVSAPCLQHMKEQPMFACGEDIMSKCPEVTTHEEVANCLHSHRDELSAVCVDSLNQMHDRMADGETNTETEQQPAAPAAEETPAAPTTTEEQPAPAPEEEKPRERGFYDGPRHRVHFGGQTVTTAGAAAPSVPAAAPAQRGPQWGVILGGVGFVALLATVVVVVRRRRNRRAAAAAMEPRVQMMNPAVDISRPLINSV